MKTAKTVKLIISFLMGILFFCPRQMVFAQSAQPASFVIIPSSGTYAQNETFDVVIYLNTGGESVSAVDAILTYEDSKFEVVSITEGTEFTSYPSKASSGGTIIVSAVTTGGVSGTSIKVATVKLKVLQSSGSSAVEFVMGESGAVSSVIKEGTTDDILGAATGGTYTFTAESGDGTTDETTDGTTDGTTGETQPATGSMGSAFPTIAIGVLMMIGGRTMIVNIKKKHY